MEKIYGNVVDYRVYDDGKVCEGVTTVTLPDINHIISQISDAGMVMDVDYPDPTRFESMEYAVNHNNGVGCNRLCNPGRHEIETRVARNVYKTTEGNGDFEGMKVRIVGLHKGRTGGTIEAKNPYGSTDKYSVIRYEVEINGEVVILIDSSTGKVRINGQSQTDKVKSLIE